jgi:hypothetical protein
MVNVNEISKFLENKFSDADKVEYFNEMGGYWDVVYYREDEIHVESFKLVEGKLKNFSSMVYDDGEMYEEE